MFLEALMLLQEKGMIRRLLCSVGRDSFLYNASTVNRRGYQQVRIENTQQMFCERNALGIRKTSHFRTRTKQHGQIF